VYENKMHRDMPLSNQLSKLILLLCIYWKPVVNWTHNNKAVYENKMHRDMPLSNQLSKLILLLCIYWKPVVNWTHNNKAVYENKMHRDMLLSNQLSKLRLLLSSYWKPVVHWNGVEYIGRVGRNEETTHTAVKDEESCVAVVHKAAEIKIFFSLLSFWVKKIN
jgi:hypothetical protein